MVILRQEGADPLPLAPISRPAGPAGCRQQPGYSHSIVPGGFEVMS